jgi:cell wall-associated NlpC family hydrolase
VGTVVSGAADGPRSDLALKVGSAPSDANGMSRTLLLAVLALALLAPAALAQPRTLANWDLGDQRAVVAAGLLAPLGDGRFHGERPLTAAALRGARDVLAFATGTPRASVPGAGSATVSVRAFDAVLVGQLGLGDVADAVQAEARRAGLAPPPSFGTEVVARALGLRFNHPFPYGEALEPYPWQPVTRAEAAYSLARVGAMHGWEADAVRTTFSAFTLPALDAAQRRALRVAVSRIGMPYIWGGETDRASLGQAHGGYDCSGFAWRVFKMAGLRGVRFIGGRTADDQAHEIPRRSRLSLARIRPGDLLFFGHRGYADHEGIALGNGFMIHASGQGVYVVPIRDGFLWGRRVL